MNGGMFEEFECPDKKTQLTDALIKAQDGISGESSFTDWTRQDRWALGRIAKGEALQLELNFNDANDCLESAVAFFGGGESIGQDPETAYEDFSFHVGFD